MKKRIVSILLAAAMCASVYACGATQNTNTQPKTETVSTDSAVDSASLESETTTDENTEETVSDGDIPSETITTVTEYPEQIESAKDCNNTLILLMNHDKEYGNASKEISDTGYFYNTISGGARVSQHYENVSENASVSKFYDEVASVKELLGGYGTTIFATTAEDIESYSIELATGDDGTLSVISVAGQALYSEDTFNGITIGANYDTPADYIDGYGYSGLIFYVQDDSGKNIGICLLANYNEEDDATLSDAATDASSANETVKETE